MDHVKSLTFRRRKWFVLIMGMLMMPLMMLKGVAAEDQTGVPAAAGLLCISDCVTCPVICSPPPPPSPKESHSPTAPSPTSHHSPPQSYYHSPPPPPPERTSEPPSSSWGSPPPPPPPPPPFKYNNNVPPGQLGPPTPTGQHDYPYPYYYFYASKASFLSCDAYVLPVMLFYFVVLFFC